MFPFFKCPMTFIGSQIHRKEIKASKEVKMVWKPYTDFWSKEKRTELMIYRLGLFPPSSLTQFNGLKRKGERVRWQLLDGKKGGFVYIVYCIYFFI